MQYTALTRTISEADIVVSSSDVGKVAQFFDSDENSYWGIIASVSSDSSIVLSVSENLPSVDCEIFDCSVVIGDAQPYVQTNPKTFTSVFRDEYKYYRVYNGSSSGVSYSAFLSETYIDRLIMYKALELIYRGVSKDASDIWMVRAQQAAQFYESALSSYKMTVDVNNDGKIDDNDTQRTAQRRLTR